MDVAEVTEILRSCPALHEASAAFSEAKPHLWNRDGKIHFALRADALSPEMVTMFHSTPYLLIPIPVEFFGEGMLYVSIRDKEYMDRPPDLCFHVTRAANVEGVRARGLLSGIEAGIAPRSNYFWESQFFIYASATLEEGQTWFRERLGEKGLGVAIPINRKELGCRLINDPAGQSQDVTLGYILEIDRVHPSYLGAAISIH